MIESATSYQSQAAFPDNVSLELRKPCQPEEKQLEHVMLTAAAAVFGHRGAAAA
jgi:hypothetical protein